MTCPPKTSPGIMLVQGLERGDRWSERLGGRGQRLLCGGFASTETRNNAKGQKLKMRKVDKNLHYALIGGGDKVVALLAFPGCKEKTKIRR